jgi:hypothetical protein
VVLYLLAQRVRTEDAMKPTLTQTIYLAALEQAKAEQNVLKRAA